jgi:arylsulfatase A-like enzyme
VSTVVRTLCTLVARVARRAALLLAAACATLLPGCNGDEAEQAAAARPDLVLVVVDTLRADHLSTYGYARPTSPGLDALGAQGVVFLDNTAQSSWTLPSVASIFLGRHLFVNAQRLPDGVPSLAERLKDAGYETAAFLGNPAVSDKGGYHRGFDHFIGRETTGNVTWDGPALQAAVERWLAAHPRTDKPRFIYLHFMDPHWEYAAKHGPPVAGKVVLRDDTIDAWVRKAKAGGPGTLLHDHFDEDRKYILEQLDAYDHEIALMDRSLTATLAALDAGPGRERLVVVAADHGEGLWDHLHHAPVVADKVPPEQHTLREVFFRYHSYHLWQELLHTPLIVSGTGFAAGARLTTPVENVDIAPTLLRAAGLPNDPALTGRALQDVVAGTARPRPVLYSFCNEGTAVRLADKGWKFIFPTATGDSYEMYMQLYHLPDDPHERRNRVEDPAAIETLKRLVKLREDAAASFHLYDDERVYSEDAEQEKVLQELGYAGNRPGAPATPIKPPETDPAATGPAAVEPEVPGPR